MQSQNIHVRSRVRRVLTATIAVGMFCATTAGIVSAAPTISSISPEYGPASGGTTVTITGSGFVEEELGDKYADENKITASDGAASDYFGKSVAISGDYALVGASGNDDNGSRTGSAYIFARDPSGNWSQIQKLTASDGAAYDAFGLSVAISGDYALVGAYWDDDNGSNSGSAYIFERDPSGTWSEVQKLTASDGATNDYFGSSVAISGDYALVGASGNGLPSGSAYIFERDQSGNWSEVQKLTASDGATNDYFGSSVAISGDYALVGAPGNDDNGSWSGSAYIFERDPSGTWSEVQKLTASDGAADDFFGYSVAISGDYALVGAQYDDDNNTDSGSAYIFERDPSGTWSEVQKITASDGAADDRFGYSVAISGDYALVGAYRDDDNGSYSGSAYIFERDPSGTWSEVQKLTASDGAADDFFGRSVAISGDYALVGAYSDDDNGTDSGSAYIFEEGLLPISASLDGTPCTTTTYISPTSLTCEVPPHAGGPVPVTVSNPDGSNQVLDNGFTYHNYIENTDNSIQVVEANTGRNLASGNDGGYGIEQVRIKHAGTGLVVSEVDVDLFDNRDWGASTGGAAVSADASLAEKKAVIANLDPTKAPGAASSHTLYIPRATDDNAVVICPDANDLASIDVSCSNGVTFAHGHSQTVNFPAGTASVTVTQTSLDGQLYWKAEGVLGTGGISVYLSGNFGLHSVRLTSFGLPQDGGTYLLHDSGGEAMSGHQGLTTSSNELGGGGHYPILANAQAAPIATNPTASGSELSVVIDDGANVNDTRFSLAASTDNWTTTYFVQTDGTLSTTEVLQTYSDWGGVLGETVTGLLPGTTYCFKTRAYHGDFTGTRWSEEACATTLLGGCVMDLGTADVMPIGIMAVGTSYTAEHNFSIDCSGTTQFSLSIQDSGGFRLGGDMVFSDTTAASPDPSTSPLATCAASHSEGCFGVHVAESYTDTDFICDSDFTAGNYSGLDENTAITACSASDFVDYTEGVDAITVEFGVQPGADSAGGAYSNVIYYTLQASF